MRNRILLALIFSMFLSGQSHGQESVTASYDSINRTWDFEDSELTKITRLDMARQDVESILFNALELQRKHGESLGVEMKLGVSREFFLDLNNELKPNQVTLDIDSLTTAKNIKSSGYLPKLNAISSNDLVGAILNKEIRDFLIGADPTIQQSTEPLPVTGLPKNISSTLKKNCKKYPNRCVDLNVSVAASGLNATLKPQINDKLKKCSVSRETFYEDIERKLDTLLHSNSSDWKNIFRSVKINNAFETSCLAPPNNLDKNILNNIAVFRLKDGIHPFCTGYRIGPTQILTAMHCFMMGDKKANKEFFSKVSVSVFSSPDKYIPIDAEAHHSILDLSGHTGIFSLPKSPNDILIINTKRIDDLTSDEFKITFSKPRIGERTIIPGYFVFNKEVTKPRNDMHIGRQVKWTNGIKIDSRRSDNRCSVVDTSFDGEKGCLIHNCQAIKGFSGAPVFQIDEKTNTTSIIGVHTGGFDQGNIDYHCSRNYNLAKLLTGSASQPLINDGNIAARVSQSILEKNGWSK